VIMPRLYIPLAILFWGWQSKTLWMAVPLMLVSLYAQFGRSKFDFSASDFNKFVDVSTILMAATIVLSLTLDAKKAIWMMLTWMPAVLFPVVAAQLFSTAGNIDVHSFFLSARKKNQSGNMESRRVDVSFVYVLFCILSTGINPDAGRLFLPAIVFFTVWALWYVRSKRVHTTIWAMSILVALGLGYIGQKAVRAGSIKLNHWVMLKYRGVYSNNPFKSHTALGEIGTLKLSNKIVLRAMSGTLMEGDILLLQNGVYNQFLGVNWYARTKFSPIVPSVDEEFWQINPGAGSGKKIKLYSRPQRNRAVLALPPGVTRLAGFSADSVLKNGLQVVRLENPSALIVADVSYSGQPSWDKAPYKTDFFIPKKELPGVERIVAQLRLDEKPPKQVLAVLQDFFIKNYTYSLELKGKGKHDTAVQNFLFNTRQGHCELFATATALILKKVHIPARYVTGFMVHEYSDLEGGFVVRQRDAHAWVRVFINNRWQDIDTTPPGFTRIDSQKIPTSVISDSLSFLGFKLSQLRHETGADLMNRYGMWLVLPLGGILFLRLRKKSHIKRVSRADRKGLSRIKKGDGHSFYQLENHLAKITGVYRFAFETYAGWLKRIGNHTGDVQMIAELKKMLHHHNRIQFGKKIPTGEKIELHQSVKDFIAAHPVIK